MLIAQLTGPEQCVDAELTMKEVRSSQILISTNNSVLDPFVQCNLNPCLQNPCGVNADCTNSGQRAVCKCRPNYVGDPFSSCRLEPCSTNPCGVNADCTSSGSNAVCKCRPNYTGDPYTNCNFDPCSSNPCGQGAFCENNGRAAVCKCPPQHIGDPYVSCRWDDESEFSAFIRRTGPKVKGHHVEVPRIIYIGW